MNSQSHSPPVLCGSGASRKALGDHGKGSWDPEKGQVSQESRAVPQVQELGGASCPSLDSGHEEPSLPGAKSMALCGLGAPGPSAGSPPPHRRRLWL